MPFYVFACPTCKAIKTVYSHKADGGGMQYCVGGDTPTHFESQMDRDYMAESRRHIPSSAYPMTTAHIRGTPTTYNSDREIEQDAKIHGLTRRDDAAYEEQELVQVKDYDNMLEYDVTVEGLGTRHIRKPGTKVVMKEGSGLGHPRSWAALPKLATASKEEIEEFYRGR